MGGGATAGGAAGGHDELVTVVRTVGLDVVLVREESAA